MAVDLHWLLGQGALDLRLVAGNSRGVALDWAHSIDLLDPTPWLNGQGLVLTTGLRLPRSVREQRAYAERLTDAGVPALGFGVGIRYDEIPAPLRESCVRLGLPLVEVPLSTPFIAITQAVARRLAEEQMEGLQQALDYQQRITRSAVRSGLAGVVTMLRRELRCDAVALDEYGVVMATSSRRPEVTEMVCREWRGLSSHARPGTVGITTERGMLEIQTLQGRSGVCGWLAVSHQVPLSGTDRLLVNQAAGLITLQMDWPAELTAAYHDVGGTLLALLLDLPSSAPPIIRHLNHFGFGPRDRVMLALVTAPRAPHSLLDVLTVALEATKRPHLVSRVAAGVATLLVEADAERLVPLMDRTTSEAGLDGLVIGVSQPLEQSAVTSGIGQAEQAAADARRVGHTVGWFGDLTLSSVVADDALRERVWSLAEPALAALDGVDIDLSPSLEAFLHHNGSWEAAARDLGVHRHTLKARMNKVERLTGLSLDSAESRVLLMLGLMSRPR